MAQFGILQKQNPDYLSKGQGFLNSAISTYQGQSNPHTGEQNDRKTFGGALTSMVGMGMGGFQMGGPIGGGAGALAGLAGYVFG